MTRVASNVRRKGWLAAGAWLLCAAAALMAIRPLAGELIVAGVQVPLPLALLSAALIALGASGFGTASAWAAAALVSVRPIVWAALSTKTGPLSGEQAITVVSAALQALGQLLLLHAVVRSTPSLSAPVAWRGYIAAGVAFAVAWTTPWFDAAVVIGWASVSFASSVLAGATTPRRA